MVFSSPPVHTEKTTYRPRLFLISIWRRLDTAARYRGIYSPNVKIAHGGDEVDPTAVFNTVSKPEPRSPGIKIAFNVNAKTQ